VSGFFIYVIHLNWGSFEKSLSTAGAISGLLIGVFVITLLIKHNGIINNVLALFNFRKLIIANRGKCPTIVEKPMTRRRKKSFPY